MLAEAAPHAKPLPAVRAAVENRRVSDRDTLLSRCARLTLEHVGADPGGDPLGAMVRACAPGGRFAKAIGQALDLQAEEQQQLCDDLARLASVDTSRRRLSTLRALGWFDTARERGSPVALPAFESAGPHEAVSMFRMVRALELIVRSLYAEVHGDAQRALERLGELLPPKAMKEVLRRSTGSMPLDGLEMGELVRVFVDPREWPHTGAVFENGPLRALLADKRETVGNFLDDVRRIRNRVVHHKPITAIQAELLDLYHGELLEPVRAAFPDRTRVDPGQFEAASTPDLEAYRQTVEAQLAWQEKIAFRLEQTRRLSVWTLAGLVALVALALPVVVPRVLDRIDPARGDLEAARAEPGRIGEFAVQSCIRGEPQTASRFAALPGAATALRSAEADASNMLVVQLAAARPERLLPCVAVLRGLGWNPNLLSRTEVGNDLDPGVNPRGPRGAPAGYASYRAAYAQGLPNGSAAVRPEVLHANALLYAVWHGDEALVRALLDAGADPGVPYTFSGAWIGRDADVAAFDARVEARRLGQAGILKLIEAR